MQVCDHWATSLSTRVVPTTLAIWRETGQFVPAHSHSATCVSCAPPMPIETVLGDRHLQIWLVPISRFSWLSTKMPDVRRSQGMWHQWRSSNKGLDPQSRLTKHCCEDSNAKLPSPVQMWLLRYNLPRLILSLPKGMMTH